MSLENYDPVFLSITEHGDVVVAKLTREHLGDEENIEQLGQEMFAIVDQFERDQIVLDLEKVDYVTSSVIGKIIAMHRRLHRGDGKLVLCSLGENVKDILVTASLLQYFHVADNVPDAVALFTADS